MCLVIKSGIPRLAVRDIVCWKVVSKLRNSETAFSPLQFKHGSSLILYELGEIALALRSGYGRLQILEDILLSKYLGPGFCHSYLRYEDIDFKKVDREESVVLKCIIPRGTFYYKGKLSGDPDVRGYASRKIKPISIEYSGINFIRHLKNYGWTVFSGATTIRTMTFGDTLVDAVFNYEKYELVVYRDNNESDILFGPSKVKGQAEVLNILDKIKQEYENNR